MLPSIKPLDETLINKIAAGEVVERPASVVKELVENSIDAHAKTIVVKINEGGKKLISVIDDGVGIHPQELKLSVARHATSKITTFDDLYALQSKGFRGEALASIASVSKLEVASVRAGFEAKEIIVHGGEMIDERAVALAKGTRVTVQFLFYQTPARLKFLRTSETEAAHVTDVISHLALCHPFVHFSLYHNDKLVLDVPSPLPDIERIGKVWGNDLKPWLYPIEAVQGPMALRGFFGHPQVARSQRKGMLFFVNGRVVNDKILMHASLEAYRDLLMKGKYPVLILHLNVQEDLIDVNVHPQKSEVRFHHSQQIHAFVKESLRAHLKKAPWIAGEAEAFAQNLTSDSEALHSYAPRENKAMPSSVQSSLEMWSERALTQTHPEPIKNHNTQSPQKFIPKDEKRQIQFGKTAFDQMQPIGQWMGTYILCASGNKLILIDQHAAHERVGFEKLMLELESKGLAKEALLVPETFDLKPSDADILKHYLTELSDFGFEVDFFGGQTFVLKSVPVLLKGKINFLNMIRDLIDDIRETRELKSLKDKCHHVLATMACHAQIRAHHHLTLTEMSALLNELNEYQFTDFCPHGRPVSVEVTQEEVEKWFRRIL